MALLAIAIVSSAITLTLTFVAASQSSTYLLGAEALVLTIVGLVAFLSFAFPIIKNSPFEYKLCSHRAKQLCVLVFAITILVTTFIILLAIDTGSLHDYAKYQRTWHRVLEGKNPWKYASTAYGPAFKLLALLYYVNPLLPKVLFVVSWLMASLYVLTIALKQRASIEVTSIIFLLLVLGALFWSYTVVYGTFDSLVAALCLCAIVCKINRKDVCAAIVLAVAVLLKYYPLAIAPFMFFDQRSINWRFGIVFLTILAAGVVTSLAIWGPGIFNPLGLAATRAAKTLSIFRFLEGQFSPLRFFADRPKIAYLSVPMAAIGTALAVVVAWIYRLRLLPAVMVGVIILLTFYKVGHTQFFAIVPLLTSYWLARQNEDFFEKPFWTGAILMYSVWLGVAGTIELYSGWDIGQIDNQLDKEWKVLRNILGLPTFIFASFAVTGLVIKELGRESPSVEDGVNTDNLRKAQTSD